jgi:hypothetical protein
MRIKIFVPNSRGKIELTKEELEQLLNESYSQGWADKPDKYHIPYYYYGAYPSNISTTSSSMDAILNSQNEYSAIANTIKEELELEGYKVKFENETA